jgi:hypothetical protein
VLIAAASARDSQLTGILQGISSIPACIRDVGAQLTSKFKLLRPNSLRIGTASFVEGTRGFGGGIGNFSCQIESAVGSDFRYTQVTDSHGHHPAREDMPVGTVIVAHQVGWR